MNPFIPFGAYFSKLEKKDLGYICSGFILCLCACAFSAFTAPVQTGNILRNTAQLISPQQTKSDTSQSFAKEINQKEINLARWLSFNLGYLDQSFTATFKCQEEGCSKFFFHQSIQTVDSLIDQVQRLKLDRRIEEDLVSFRTSLLNQEETIQTEGEFLKNYKKFCNIEARLHKAISEKFHLPNLLTNIEKFEKKKIQTLLKN
ncbi:MAG: hypothetical protein SFU25_01690 [Candidatus Caenarcaniphilales bacterium]|nr:hypothetical protein [Candidatus Caenarcaniphilales bacterium]